MCAASLLEVILLCIYQWGTKKILSAQEELIQESVEKQLKAERMKIDLITNVSHDLKTPLTSIISYIDLLSKEELSQTAEDYVTVLENKAERLKKMIEDVFDLSKATSGELKPRLKQVDMRRLLIQTLTDMQDAIETAPVKVTQEIPEQTAVIESDGEKLYRVLQNLMENALRYSMPDTRVYVTLQVNAQDIQIEIKNVANYEMNFTEEEIMGRFVRGDKARSTQGSGLGLNIAKEFTRLCGGRLKVIPDGDVFRVVLTFLRTV
ncbi:MAG: HAMP domain-containing histidine kinase [Lachnospiraceae bacterium]|nr:HAMP domain-containing histidine kinase [Lachnospiraceae bacterium]